MKKIVLSVLLCFSIQFLFAAFTVPSKVNEREVGNSELTVAVVSKMSFREFKQYTFHKSGFKNRIAFLLLKKELKQQVKAGDGHMNIASALSALMDDARFRFNLVGFGAGLFFGIFGVGLSYIFTKNKNVHRSAWIGFGALVILVMIAIFSIFPA